VPGNERLIIAMTCYVYTKHCSFSHLFLFKL